MHGVTRKTFYFKILVAIFNEDSVNGMRSEVLNCPGDKYIYIFVCNPTCNGD